MNARALLPSTPLSSSGFSCPPSAVLLLAFIHRMRPSPRPCVVSQVKLFNVSAPLRDSLSSSAAEGGSAADDGKSVSGFVRFQITRFVSGRARLIRCCMSWSHWCVCLCVWVCVPFSCLPLQSPWEDAHARQWPVGPAIASLPCTRTYALAPCSRTFVSYCTCFHSLLCPRYLVTVVPHREPEDVLVMMAWSLMSDAEQCAEERARRRMNAAGGKRRLSGVGGVRLAPFRRTFLSLLPRFDTPCRFSPNIPFPPDLLLLL
jgi:hypothetical protein